VNSQSLSFETPRLKMRPLGKADRELCCRLFTDEETMKFLGGPLSDEAAIAMFRSMLRANSRQPGRNVYLSITSKTGCEPLGLCSAMRIDHLTGRAELGLMMAGGERSKGLGREAFSGLIAAALQEFSLQELQVHYHAQNAAIKRLLTLAGFSFAQKSGEAHHEMGRSLELASLTSERWLLG
jgi:RimJ/RimL family protein N-acetyltransferase